jgi:hypothetical protein
MVPSIAGLVPWCLFSSAHRQALLRLPTGGTPPANRRSGDALHDAGRRRDEGRATGTETRGRAAAVGQGRGIIRLDRHRRVSEGHVGAALPAPIEGRLERGFQGLDVGDPVRVRLIQTDVERGFIDFARA